MFGAVTGKPVGPGGLANTLSRWVDCKCRTWKWGTKKDETLEHAGPENAGPNVTTWKCRTRKWRTKWRGMGIFMWWHLVLHFQVLHFLVLHFQRPPSRCSPRSTKWNSACTDADGSLGGGFSHIQRRLSVCLCVSLSARLSKTDAVRITKPDVDMFHGESWKPTHFGVKRSKVKVTIYKNIAGVGFCTPWSAAFFWFVVYACTIRYDTVDLRAYCAQKLTRWPA